LSVLALVVAESGRGSTVTVGGRVTVGGLLALTSASMKAKRRNTEKLVEAAYPMYLR
jgi:hypothetical protein